MEGGRDLYGRDAVICLEGSRRARSGLSGRLAGRRMVALYVAAVVCMEMLQPVAGNQLSQERLDSGGWRGYARDGITSTCQVGAPSRTKHCASSHTKHRAPSHTDRCGTELPRTQLTMACRAPPRTSCSMAMRRASTAAVRARRAPRARTASRTATRRGSTAALRAS